MVDKKSGGNTRACAQPDTAQTCALHAFARGLRLFGRQWKAYGKLDLLWFLRDTRYCLLQICADFVCTAASLAGVWLLAARLGGFGGLTRPQLLFMLAYATQVNGVYMMLFAGANAGNISRVIGRGQLDHNLLQPVPLWMQLCTQGFSPVSGSGMLIAGAGLALYAARQCGVALTPLWLLAIAGCALASAAMIVSSMYSISALAFYAPAAAEEIAPVVYDFYTSLQIYPLGGLGGLAQAVFCTAVPVGLTAWLPARLLLHAAPPGAAWFLITMACVFLSGAVLLFRKGMVHYAKKGSPRYSGFGHR